VGTPAAVDPIRSNRGTLDLGKLDCLVLDEATEMLNMGFLKDVNSWLEKTRRLARSHCFSGPLPGPIRNIGRRRI